MVLNELSSLVIKYLPVTGQYANYNSYLAVTTISPSPTYDSTCNSILVFMLLLSAMCVSVLIIVCVCVGGGSHEYSYRNGSLLLVDPSLA